MNKSFLIALSIMVFTLISNLSIAQNQTKVVQSETKFSYAYLSVRGKLFSKKLNVQVDLGDTPDQMREGEEFTQKLSNKTSYAAVLNYMIRNGFELVNTLDLSSTYQGSGGTTGIVFIMRKKEDILGDI